MRDLRLVFVFCGLAALVPSAARSQSQNTAAIRGRVLDQTGGSVPGAAITIVNTATGMTRETTTDRDGFYTLSGLPLTGAYRVRIALAGFTTREIDRVELRAGESVTVDAALGASGGTSEVTVFGSVEGVRADTPQLGLRLDADEIEERPIAGRKLTNLPLLDASIRPARGVGDLFLNNTLIVVNGSGRRQTTFVLDGSTGDDAWGRQTVFTNVPLSSVQEVTILTNAFSAEYGRTTGAAINIVTKAGTNVTKGDLLGLLRPAALETRNPIAAIKTPDVLTQVSGSVGGPLVENRTQYFVSAEYNHQKRDALITSSLVPRNTTFTGTYNQALVDGRVDYSPGAGRTLTLKINVDGFSDTNPADAVGGIALPSAARTFTRRAYGAQASYTTVIGEAMLNDARLQALAGEPITAFRPSTPSTQFVRPGLAIEGESRYATLFNHQYQLVDSLSVSKGRHNLKLGADLAHSKSGGDGQEFGSGFVLGQFTVKTGIAAPLSQLTLNDMQSFTQSFGTSTYVVNEWLWAAFAQDNVKLRSDLTANAGVRYERQTFTDDTNNLSPRLGLTYNPGGDPKTVLRGGYGIYYSEIKANTAAGFTIGGPAGVFTYTAQPGQLGFPAVLGPIAAFPAGAVLPPRNITIRPGMAAYYSQFFDVSRLKNYPDKLLNPSTQSATVGIERELPGKWFVGTDYVRQVTTGIDRPLDVNAPAPFVRTEPGQLRSAAAADATRPILPAPNGYRRILAVVNTGDAGYDALQVNLSKRFSPRFSLIASYTLSKTTNTVEPDVPGQDPNDPNFLGDAERGPSILDQRHRAVVSGWWRLPYQVDIGGVVTMASGRPYNITTGADNNGDGSNTDRPVVNGAVLGRDAGRGSAIYDTSAFVERTFSVAASRDVSIRVEAFNLFNHDNIVGRNGTYGNAASGVALSTLGAPLGGINNVDPGRQVQLMGRIRF